MSTHLRMGGVTHARARALLPSRRASESWVFRGQFRLFSRVTNAPSALEKSLPESGLEFKF